MDLERRTDEKCTVDIVTWRGMMTKIMSIPFDMRNGFEMKATKFQGTLFIEESHHHKMTSRGTPSRRQDIMSFWGYKFETLATLPQHWDECSRDQIESRLHDVVSNKAQFCSIVKTGFGDIGLVLGGEVDAVWDERPATIGDPTRYVELKTSREIRSERDEIAFERKLQRIWAQSFLLGVEKVICGFRDDEGVLRRVKEFETEELPILAEQSGRNLWNDQFSIDFIHSVLKWLLETIPDDGVFLIQHRENSATIDVIKTEEPTFLLPSFLRWRTEKHRS